MVPLRMSSIGSVVGVSVVAYIGLLYPCEITSQYVCFCSLNSGVFHNTLHSDNCAKTIGLGLRLGIAFHFSIIIRLLGLGLGLRLGLV